MERALKITVLLSHIVLTITFFTAWTTPFWANLLGLASGFQFHLASALIGVLLSLFANLCIIFYFVGTGVWMKDRAKEVLSKDRDCALRIYKIYEIAGKLKGKSFPLASLAIVLALFTFILGGALQVGATWQWLHRTLAALLVLISWLEVKPVWAATRINLDYLDQVSTEVETFQDRLAASRA